ncbi:hypothetical protein O9A_01076 [Bartonella koehlerae C-29]|uniref:Uncharacterized protein n=2 Tax=Bartonella koehlerae TaxID=92181 RepID=A0A067WEX8_9HYPH|nr:hypothetical protein O9A_01076 [Bartonella koehlerae C-29]
METSDFVLRATTNTRKLTKKADVITMIFSTYHLIQIICDKTFRTTEETLLKDKSESNFTKVYDNRIIPYKKHLYMTATTHIFSNAHQKRTDEINAVLISMDDKKFYGKQLHHYTFVEAEDNELLTPYKIIIVLGIDDEFITPGIRNIIVNKNYKLDFDDSAKILTAIEHLPKQIKLMISQY